MAWGLDKGRGGRSFERRFRSLKPDRLRNDFQQRPHPRSASGASAPLTGIAVFPILAWLDRGELTIRACSPLCFSTATSG